jgi:hypothetical protein
VPRPCRKFLRGAERSRAVFSSEATFFSCSSVSALGILSADFKALR